MRNGKTFMFCYEKKKNFCVCFKNKKKRLCLFVEKKKCRKKNVPNLLEVKLNSGTFYATDQELTYIKKNNNDNKHE